MRILIIDDDLSIIKMLKEMLHFDHQVEGTTSPENAIERLKHNNYDLIFLDYDMPEHDGQWFMKNAHLPDNTIVILLTGNLNKEILPDMFRLGISGYLVKPVSLDDVQRNLDFYSHSGEYSDYAATA